MKKYIAPEYNNDNQLEDIILISVVENPEENMVTGIVDIEDLFG